VAGLREAHARLFIGLNKTRVACGTYPALPSASCWGLQPPDRFAPGGDASAAHRRLQPHDQAVPATAHRPGPLSESSSGPTGGISVGVSQNGLALANDRSRRHSATAARRAHAVTDSFSSAPTCSWTPHRCQDFSAQTRYLQLGKQTGTGGFPAHTIALHPCGEFVIASPWTGAASIYNSAPGEKTGRKSRKRAGVSLPPQPIHSQKRAEEHRSQALRNEREIKKMESRKREKRIPAQFDFSFLDSRRQKSRLARNNCLAARGAPER